MREGADAYRVLGIIFTILGASFAGLFVVLATMIGMPMMMMPALVVGLPFLASGVGMLIYRNVLDMRRQRLELSGMRVMGTITAFLGTAQQLKGETLQQAVVRGDNGKRYVSGAFRFSQFDWEVGDRMLVLVDPDDPSKYMIDVTSDGPQDLPRTDDYDALEPGPMFPQMPAGNDDEPLL